MSNNAEKVVEAIINRGIDWVNISKLDKGKQTEYKADAKRIAENYTFNNELNHYIADLIKFIAYESRNHDQTCHVRAMIVGLETFKKRLESVEEPTPPLKVENPHEAI